MAHSDPASCRRLELNLLGYALRLFVQTKPETAHNTQDANSTIRLEHNAQSGLALNVSLYGFGGVLRPRLKCHNRECERRLSSLHDDGRRYGLLKANCYEPG
jgi:hypothetical protein